MFPWVLLLIHQYASHAITQNLSGNYVLFFTAQTIFPPATALMGITTTTWWAQRKALGLQTNPQGYHKIVLLKLLMIRPVRSLWQWHWRIVRPRHEWWLSEMLILHPIIMSKTMRISISSSISIDWASKQDQSINLTPRQVTKRVLVNPTTESMNVIFVITVVTIPFCADHGIIVWYIDVGKLMKFVSRHGFYYSICVYHCCAWVFELRKSSKDSSQTNLPAILPNWNGDSIIKFLSSMIMTKIAYNSCATKTTIGSM